MNAAAGKTVTMNDYPFLKFTFMMVISIALLIVISNPIGFMLVGMPLGETKAPKYILGYWYGLFNKIKTIKLTS